MKTPIFNFYKHPLADRDIKSPLAPPYLPYLLEFPIESKCNNTYMSLLTKPLCSVQHRLSAPLFCSTVQHILLFLCSAHHYSPQKTANSHNCFCLIYISSSEFISLSVLSKQYPQTVTETVQLQHPQTVAEMVQLQHPHEPFVHIKWYIFEPSFFFSSLLFLFHLLSNHHFKQLLNDSQFGFIITVNPPTRIPCCTCLFIYPKWLQTTLFNPDVIV